MEIGYSCSVDDYVSYYLWTRLQNKSAIARYWERSRVALSSAALPLLGALLTKDDLGNQNIWRLCASIAAVMFVIYFFWFPQSVSRSIANWTRSAYQGKGGINYLGKKTVRLLETSLWLKTQASESTTGYAAITSIVETSTHIFIMYGPSAQIIPRAKIESGDLVQFIIELRKHLSGEVQPAT